MADTGAAVAPAPPENFQMQPLDLSCPTKKDKCQDDPEEVRRNIEEAEIECNKYDAHMQQRQEHCRAQVSTFCRAGAQQSLRDYVTS